MKQLFSFQGQLLAAEFICLSFVIGVLFLDSVLQKGI